MGRTGVSSYKELVVISKTMMDFFRNPKLSLVFRLLMGVMILVSAVPKVVDIEHNSVYLVYSYYILPLQPVNVARLVGVIIPFVELLYGIGLILGIFTRIIAVGWAILSLAYLGVKLDIIFLQQRVIPCGCFSGLFPAMLVTQSIWLDVASILMCLQVFLFEAKHPFLSPGEWLKARWHSHF